MFQSSALEQFDVVRLVDKTHGLVSNLSNLTVYILLLTFMTASLSFTLNPVFTLKSGAAFFQSVVYGLTRNSLAALKLKVPTFTYYSVLLALFLCISNVSGTVPYSLTITSFICITLFWSAVGFFAALLVGLIGFKWNFFSLFMPSGTPNVLKGGLVFIEFVSYFARLFSLAIRLFANLMAGHALLKILSGFGWVFLFAGRFNAFLGLIITGVVLLITILEFLIAFLQAYVFLTLALVYLNEAVNLH